MPDDGMPDDEALATWRSWRGPSPDHDVRVVELTLTVSTPRAARGVDWEREAKSHADVLELVRRLLVGVEGERMPKWLRVVEVDAIYDRDDD